MFHAIHYELNVYPPSVAAWLQTKLISYHRINSRKLDIVTHSSHKYNTRLCVCIHILDIPYAYTYSVWPHMHKCMYTNKTSIFTYMLAIPESLNTSTWCTGAKVYDITCTKKNIKSTTGVKKYLNNFHSFYFVTIMPVFVIRKTHTTYVYVYTSLKPSTEFIYGATTGQTTWKLLP